MPDIVVTRTFDATAQQVWNAWTDPEQVMRWWGPQGWTYSHLAEPGRLEFTMGFSDADGNPVDPASLGLPPDIPHPVRHVVQIRAGNGRTELTVTEFGYADGPTYELSKAGLEQCLDKMTGCFSSPG